MAGPPPRQLQGPQGVTVDASGNLVMADGDRIRDQARAALRLDIGERLRDARNKLGDELTFGSEKGCFHGDVDRIEVTGVHPHAAYLRVYVAVTARARATFPCTSPGP